jgi:hypothetical protein
MCRSTRRRQAVVRTIEFSPVKNGAAAAGSVHWSGSSLELERRGRADCCGNRDECPANKAVESSIAAYFLRRPQPKIFSENLPDVTIRNHQFEKRRDCIDAPKGSLVPIWSVPIASSWIASGMRNVRWCGLDRSYPSDPSTMAVEFSELL